jgi:hypothetical protein
MVQEHYYTQIYQATDAGSQFMHFFRVLNKYIHGLQSNNDGAVPEQFRVTEVSVTAYGSIRNPYLKLNTGLSNVPLIGIFFKESYDSTKESRKFVEEYEKFKGHPGYPYFQRVAFSIDQASLQYGLVVENARKQVASFGNPHAIYVSIKVKGQTSGQEFDATLSLLLDSIVGRGFMNNIDWGKIDPHQLWHFRNLDGHKVPYEKHQAIFKCREEVSGEVSNYFERITGIQQVA